MHEVSHFTFFKPFGDEFKLVKGAAEGSYMVQNLLCDGVENLKKKRGAPYEGLWYWSAENLKLSPWLPSER